MARLRLLVGLVAALVIAAPAQAQTDAESSCITYPPADVPLPNGYPFDPHRAVTLFRFHRQAEAVRYLDAARKTARGPWRWRLPPDRRKEIAAALDRLRQCLARASPPPLSTLRLSVVGRSADETGAMGLQAGARVFVEGLAIGRTRSDGTLTARVPSGAIQVEAEVPIDQWNWADLNLVPGQSQSSEITLSEGKEVDERTDLVIAEAADDIVAVTSKSLTLRFMRDGRFVPVSSIDRVDAEDLNGNLLATLDGYFHVVNGAIVATAPKTVFGALAAGLDGTIRLQVHAMASERQLHQGDVAFRVGQSPLSVTLAAPPSNPALDVSKIQVGLSLVGAGIAIERVSGDAGRIRVGAFPHGSVAVECVTVSNGKYYYCDAILAHRAPRAVTVVLRHVDDLKRGVPGLRIDNPATTIRPY